MINHSLQTDRNTDLSAHSRVLVIAPHGSYRTAPFIHVAKQQNAEVLIASQGKYSIVSEYAQGLQINLSNEAEAIQTIIAAANERPFSGIIGTDDATTVLAAQAAATLGLPHNPPDAVRIAGRKDLARACLAKAGVKVPTFRKLDLQSGLTEQLIDLDYPLVVKPVGLSASRGVIRVNNETELLAAVARIQTILNSEQQLAESARQTLLLEHFIPGQEVALEGMLYNGELEVLSIIDKPDPMDGPFFEETYYISPSNHSDEIQQAIYQEVQAACRAYGLLEGPVHAECRINEQGVWILEVAARTIGGLCSRLVQLGTGSELEELVLAHAQGKHIEMTEQQGAAGVLMIPIPKAGILKRIEGILAAQRVPRIDEVNIQIRDGYELVPLPEGGSYLGFIFASGDTTQQVEIALRNAHACLNIVVAPLWKVQI